LPDNGSILEQNSFYGDLLQVSIDQLCQSCIVVLSVDFVILEKNTGNSDSQLGFMNETPLRRTE
jgi:hypothetical protein